MIEVLCFLLFLILGGVVTGLVILDRRLGTIGQACERQFDGELYLSSDFLRIADPDGKEVYLNLANVTHIDFNVQEVEGRKIYAFLAYSVDGNPLPRMIQGRPAMELANFLEENSVARIGGAK